MKSSLWGNAVVACLLVILLGNTAGHADTFTVTKIDDTNDFSCDEFDCSLREAIINANSTPGLDTIILPPGTFVLDIVGFGEDDSLTGDLDITDDLNILGAGPTRTRIDGNRIDRVFHIDPKNRQVFVSLAALSIENGLTPIIATSTEEAAGGGILNKGLLSLTDVHITNNEAATTGTGGGIHNMGNTKLFKSEISSNTASRGGGIYNDGSMELLSSTLNANITTSVVFDPSGGGIFNQGTLFVEGTAIFDNFAYGFDGGGIYNNNILHLTNSTVDNNTSTYGNGGGIFNADEATLSNVTITNNNSQGGNGGGIFNNGIVDIGNSLLANNIAAGFVSNCFPVDGVITHGYNLEDSDSCNFHNLGDQPDTEPLLLSRQISGGFTPTVGLQPSSPAVDSGNPGGCSDIVDGTSLTTDQRALPRPVDGNSDGLKICDIGAFEYNSTRPAGANLALKFEAIDNPILAGETAIYQATVFNAGPETATNTQVVIELPDSFIPTSIHTSQGSCDIVPASGLLLQNFNCSLGTVPEYGTAIISFSGRPGNTGKITLNASISSDQADEVPDNNYSSVTTTVLSATSLRLKSPNGGEVLQSGSLYMIRWAAPAKASKFKLKYSLNNGSSWNLIDVVENTTNYNWSIPDVTKTRPNCIVKIVAFNSHGKRLDADSSNGKFTITPQPSTVITPNGGEVFYGGTPVVMNWAGASNAVRYRINLSLDNGKHWNFVEEVENSTQIIWTVPVLPVDYTSCLIKLIAFDAGGQRLSVDVSDTTFSILQSAQVTYPNGGELLIPGESVTLQWTALPVAVRFQVAYSINNGMDWTTIGDIENQHEIPWLVPSVISKQQYCLVRVIAFDANDTTLADDRSDKPFTIIGPDPFLMVLTPDRGDKVPYGEFVNVSWMTNNINTEVGQILLEYSLDRGRSWSTIKALGPGKTSYGWRPPPVPADVNTCKVRVTLLDLAGQKILADKSSGTFTLFKAAGDPWNYFPFEQGRVWNYAVTETENGIVSASYPQNLEVIGYQLRRGVMTTVFRSSDQNQIEDNYLRKTRKAITDYGTSPADAISKQFVPYKLGKFPLIAGRSFVQVDKQGLNFGEDLDSDGKNESLDLKSVVMVRKYTDVTVPAGTFSDCVLIRTVITMDVTLSSNGRKATAIGIDKEWAAPGVGIVRNELQVTVKVYGVKEVSTMSKELLNYSIPQPPS